MKFKIRIGRNIKNSMEFHFIAYLLSHKHISKHKYFTYPYQQLYRCLVGVSKSVCLLDFVLVRVFAMYTHTYPAHSLTLIRTRDFKRIFRYTQRDKYIVCHSQWLISMESHYYKSSTFRFNKNVVLSMV